MCFFSLSLSPWKAVIPKLLGKPVAENKVQQMKENLELTVKVLQTKFLQEKSFLCGSQISIADLHAYCHLQQVTGPTSWHLNNMSITRSAALWTKRHSYVNIDMISPTAKSGRVRHARWEAQVGSLALPRGGSTWRRASAGRECPPAECRACSRCQRCPRWNGGELKEENEDADRLIFLIKLPSNI